MPPTSKEFQRLVREIVAPALSAVGFSRPRGVGMGGWVRPEGSSWSVVWVQLSRSNYGDTPEGYLFTVEVQLGDKPIAGTAVSRARLYELLTPAEREEHLRDPQRRRRQGPPPTGDGRRSDDRRPWTGTCPRSGRARNRSTRSSTSGSATPTKGMSAAGSNSSRGCCPGRSTGSSLRRRPRPRPSGGSRVD